MAFTGILHSFIYVCIELLVMLPLCYFLGVKIHETVLTI